MSTIEDIYALCSRTGAWYGTEITHFSQRNFMGDTVLHTICSMGNLDAVKMLVSVGADVNARGDQEATPLFNAVIGEAPEVVSYLLESGADPSIPNGYNRHVLDYAKNVGALPSIVNLLEKHKASTRKPKSR